MKEQDYQEAQKKILEYKNKKENTKEVIPKRKNKAIFDFISKEANRKASNEGRGLGNNAFDGITLKGKVSGKVEEVWRTKEINLLQKVMGGNNNATLHVGSDIQYGQNNFASKFRSRVVPQKTTGAIHNIQFGQNNTEGINNLQFNQKDTAQFRTREASQNNTGGINNIQFGQKDTGKFRTREVIPKDTKEYNNLDYALKNTGKFRTREVNQKATGGINNLDFALNNSGKFRTRESNQKTTGGINNIQFGSKIQGNDSQYGQNNYAKKFTARKVTKKNTSGTNNTEQAKINNLDAALRKFRSREIREKQKEKINNIQSGQNNTGGINSMQFGQDNFVKKFRARTANSTTTARKNNMVTKIREVSKQDTGEVHKFDFG